ncbi:hypothetical protein BD769DRAFT_1053535 [Suillus cothurnatus]|nr:hypothetical protein BD769DRAFT_1053535 [Suillus cothurnatus]
MRLGAKKTTIRCHSIWPHRPSPFFFHFFFFWAFCASAPLFPTAACPHYHKTMQRSRPPGAIESVTSRQWRTCRHRVSPTVRALYSCLRSFLLYNESRPPDLLI